MNWSEPGRELNVDPGFGEHFAEKYQAEPVICEHSHNECSPDRNVIDLARGVDKWH